MKILIIEDSLVEEKLIRSMLAKSASVTFQIESCGNLREGLTRLASENFEVLLLDLTLPDSSGLQTFFRAYECAPAIPLIVMTANDDESMGLNAVKHGAQEYLIKGQFEHHLLIRAIRYSVERCELKRNLEQMTITDPLTGLLNRRGLQQALSCEIAWVKRGMESVALLADLDDFKKINDALGHSSGDVVLREVAIRMQGVLRATDLISRIGGDEFMILLPRTRLGETLLVAEKIRRAISTTPMMISGKPVQVTASIGITEVTAETPSIDELLAKVQVALRKSKMGGKDCVVIGNSEITQAPKHYALQDVLNLLKERNSFRAVKQAILELGTGKTVAYEFLSRFCLEGFQTPDEFFRLCQENNLLALVDHYCFKNCMGGLAGLPGGERGHFNLFPSTMLGIAPTSILESLPENYKPGSICIEISEQQIIGDPSNLLESVTMFREAGILMAMDDIGFGRSSLESLIILEPEIVKIDKRCIIGIHKTPGRVHLLNRLLKVLRSLDVTIIAEGIETEEELQIVKDAGILYGQGYLWGKPA